MYSKSSINARADHLIDHGHSHQPGGEGGGEIAAQVAEFYDRLAFPSRTSDRRYLELLPRRNGERVADFGCGQSLFYDALRNYTPHPTFLDVSTNALGTIDYGWRLCADLRMLPIRDDSYDRVLCIGVIHHIPDRSAVYREMARVTAPGGRLFIGVYAPRSLQTRLKRAHEAIPFRGWQALVHAVTAGLIQFRYVLKGKLLPLSDVHRRTVDFLKVPFVHYAEPEDYATEAGAAGLRLVGTRRISSMNILEFHHNAESIDAGTRST